MIGKFIQVPPWTWFLGINFFRGLFDRDAMLWQNFSYKWLVILTGHSRSYTIELFEWRMQSYEVKNTLCLHERDFWDRNSAPIWKIKFRNLLSTFTFMRSNKIKRKQTIKMSSFNNCNNYNTRHCFSTSNLNGNKDNTLLRDAKIDNSINQSEKSKSFNKTLNFLAIVWRYLC